MNISKNNKQVGAALLGIFIIIIVMTTIIIILILLGIGMILSFLGVMLFFEGNLLRLGIHYYYHYCITIIIIIILSGNICIIMGIPLLLGPNRVRQFFMKESRMQASIITGLGKIIIIFIIIIISIIFLRYSVSIYRTSKIRNIM